MKQLKISSSSLRGVVGDGLTPELVIDFGCAFGTWVGVGEVVLARDTRRSSPLFASAVRSALISTGCSVLDAGVCPTPVAQHLVRRLGAGGAVVVTGSHNAASWNALKFINADGAILNGIQGEEVLDLYHQGEFAKAPWNGLGRVREAPDFAGPYLDEILAAVDKDAVRRAGFRVAVDLCNGTAGRIMEELLSRLGCSPILINAEGRGVFAHPPAPTRTNMEQLASLLRHVEADAGFAFNTDGDSVALVTEKGVPLSEEYTFPMAADHLLRNGPATAVTNLSTSMMIEKVMKDRGGRLIRTKIGEGHVVLRALNENALIAGEGSGGVAYLPVTCAFDGFLTTAYILEAMAKNGLTVTELKERLPSFPMRKGTVAASADRVYYALKEIRDLYGNEKRDLQDGVRVEWPGLWLHVRASNTEPLLRVIVEGGDEEEVERLFIDTIRRVNSVVHGKS